MTWLEPPTGEIAAPFPTVLSKPYWDGCARSELSFQRCEDCGGATHTPAVVCAHCTSTALRWEVSSGRGTVYSWTTVWRPVTPAFTAPYVVVIVDVEEGWQVLANLIDCEHDAVHVGLPVTVTFHARPDGAVLPYFRPAQA
jgi:uncharacterized OB-fold protein